MASSPSDLSEKLQGVQCHRTEDCVTVVNDGDGLVSPAVEPVCTKKTRNIGNGSEHVENLLSSNTTVKERGKLVDPEVVIEDKLDGGYGWVVVFASFINCCIVGTMFIGFSILYVEIAAYFDSSQGVVGWIGSLFMASGNVFGEKLHNLCFIISALL